MAGVVIIDRITIQCQSAMAKWALYNRNNYPPLIPSMSLVGETLNQRFYIVKPLGQGGFGHTYQAEDRSFNTRSLCVVKHLQPRQENLSDTALKTIKKLFEQEAKILKKLSLHSNLIPKLIDRFDEDDQLFLVQEFIDGEPLSTELKPSRKFSQAETIKLLIQILTPLEYCHKEKLIHRDLKPDNIMRRKNGDLVLIDFGIAKDLGAAEFTKEFYGGTPGYAPAEQRDGSAKPESDVDVYAVGKIAIQALTGLRPTELQRNHQTLEWEWRSLCDVTDDFAAVLNRMVKFLAIHRYQNAAEALAAVSGLSTARFKLRVKAKSPRWFISLVALEYLSLKKIIATLAGMFILTYLGYGWHNNRERYDRIESYNNSGDANHKKDKYKEALIDYNKAIELDSNSARGYSGRCAAKVNIENKIKALNDCNKAIELDPKSSLAYYSRGQIKYNIQKYGEALEDYNKAIELNPKYALAYFERGDVKSTLYQSSDRSLDRSKEAFEDYDKAIEIDPGNARVYFQRGSRYLFSGSNKYYEAIKDYDRAIELDPKGLIFGHNLHTLYEDRGRAKSSIKKYKDAIDDYSKAIQLSPTSSGAYGLRGDINYELKKYQEAISEYDKAIKLSPQDSHSYFSRGFAKFDLKKYQEAIVDFNKGVEFEPGEHDSVYITRGDAKFNLKKYQEAIIDYDIAIELNSTNELAYRKRGSAKNLVGQKQGAILDYQQAAKRYKESGETEKYQNILKEIQQLEK